MYKLFKILWAVLCTCIICNVSSHYLLCLYATGLENVVELQALADWDSPVLSSKAEQYRNLDLGGGGGGGGGGREREREREGGRAH